MLVSPRVSDRLPRLPLLCQMARFGEFSCDGPRGLGELSIVGSIDSRGRCRSVARGEVDRGGVDGRGVDEGGLGVGCGSLDSAGFSSPGVPACAVAVAKGETQNRPKPGACAIVVVRSCRYGSIADEEQPGVRGPWLR